MPSKASGDLLKDLKVLVVDDEPDSIEVAGTLLEFCGAQVFTAENGRDAIEKINVSHPHFVITDLTMPVMNGWELLTALKRDANTADLPVIALTAHSTDEDRRRTVEAGFSTYLAKPLHPETFVNELLAALRKIPQVAAMLKAK